jgi:hypothetical protein
MSAPVPCEVCGEGATACCGGCRAAFYCGKDCQRTSWRGGHKAACPDLKRSFDKFQGYIDAIDTAQAAAPPLPAEAISLITESIANLHAVRQHLHTPVNVHASINLGLFGTLHRAAEHSLANFTSPPRAVLPMCIWWDLASLMLNRSPRGHKYYVDEALTLGALSHSGEGSPPGQGYRTLLRLGRAKVKCAAALKSPMHIDCALYMWRFLAQCVVAAPLARQMLLATAEEEVGLLQDCLVVEGGGVFDQLEGLCNLFAAALCLHSETSLAGVGPSSKGLQALLTKRLNSGRKGMFTMAKSMAEAQIAQARAQGRQ